MRRLILLLSLMLSLPVWAESSAVVQEITGTAFVKAREAGASTVLKQGDSIEEGSKITTGTGGEVVLEMMDGGIIALRPETQMVIHEYHPEDDAGNVALKLLKGSLRSVTGWFAKMSPSRYRVMTPTATIGVRGTDHETSVTAGGETYEQVHEGETAVTSSKGGAPAIIKQGSFGSVRSGRRAEVIGKTAFPSTLLGRVHKADAHVATMKVNHGHRLNELVSHRVSVLRQKNPALAEKLRSRAVERVPSPPSGHDSRKDLRQDRPHGATGAGSGRGEVRRNIAAERAQHGQGGHGEKTSLKQDRRTAHDGREPGESARQEHSSPLGRDSKAGGDARHPKAEQLRENVRQGRLDKAQGRGASPPRRAAPEVNRGNPPRKQPEKRSERPHHG